MRRRPSTAASGLAGKKRAGKKRAGKKRAGKKRAGKKKAVLSGENERTAERLRRG
jgi:hypothetical protein